MKKPVIFSDFHHGSLFYSLKLLFEDRLGGTLLRPIGLEWAEQKWWEIHKPYNYNLDTAKQYLQIKPEHIPVDGTPPLNKVVSVKPTHYEVQETAHNYIQKCLTLEQFIDMDIDIIIASIPDHWITYERLRKKYKPKAKLVCQMGNIGWHNLELLKDGTVKNLLASVKPFNLPQNVHSCFYHQEVDTNVFTQQSLRGNKKISSFVIGLPDEKVFFDYKQSLPEYAFTAFASKYAPFIQTIKNLSEKIAESDFVFNHKPYGDGFGHILYSCAFVGRPLLIDFCDYNDKLGGELLEDGITAIDIGSSTVAQNIDIIRHSYPKQMGSNIAKRVRELVNYELEAIKIKNFLSNLS